MAKIFKENTTKYSMVIALVGIMIFFQIASGGILLKPLNITNLNLAEQLHFNLGNWYVTGHRCFPN